MPRVEAGQLPPGRNLSDEGNVEGQGVADAVRGRGGRLRIENRTEIPGKVSTREPSLLLFIPPLFPRIRLTETVNRTTAARYVAHIFFP